MGKELVVIGIPLLTLWVILMFLYPLMGTRYDHTMGKWEKRFYALVIWAFRVVSTLLVIDVVLISFALAADLLRRWE